jgi:hypothetical protein
MATLQAATTTHPYPPSGATSTAPSDGSSSGALSGLSEVVRLLALGVEFKFVVDCPGVCSEKSKVLEVDGVGPGVRSSISSCWTVCVAISDQSDGVLKALLIV